MVLLTPQRDADQRGADLALVCFVSFTLFVSYIIEGGDDHQSRGTRALLISRGTRVDLGPR